MEAVRTRPAAELAACLRGWAVLHGSSQMTALHGCLLLEHAVPIQTEDFSFMICSDNSSVYCVGCNTVVTDFIDQLKAASHHHRM